MSRLFRTSPLFVVLLCVLAASCVGDENADGNSLLGTMQSRSDQVSESAPISYWEMIETTGPQGQLAQSIIGYNAQDQVAFDSIVYQSTERENLIRLEVMSPSSCQADFGVDQELGEMYLESTNCLASELQIIAEQFQADYEQSNQGDERADYTTGEFAGCATLAILTGMMTMEIGLPIIFGLCTAVMYNYDF